MKKLSLVAVLIGTVMLVGCGKDISVSNIPGFEIPNNPPVVEQADAMMKATENSIILTDEDCDHGICRVSAIFTNEGGKVASDLSYSFSVDSDDINSAMTSAYADTVEQAQSTKVIYTLYYSGNLSNGKLGSIVLNYAKNAAGEREKVMVEVFKQ